MAATSRPAVVIDNGSGYSKLGFGGNTEPSFVLPSVVALKESQAIALGSGGKSRQGKKGLASSQLNPMNLSDLDFLIGEEALNASKIGTHELCHPIHHGQIENWDVMEKFWQKSIFDYLRVDSEEHYFLLTESSSANPENREYVAEIMFETFNVPGLYIANQSILSLTAGFTFTNAPMTGVVVDSGDGLTHVCPISDGFVISNAIKTLPFAGREVTSFVQQLMRERGEPIQPENFLENARTIKENFCYTSGDIVKEFAKHDKDPEKYRKLFSVKNTKDDQVYDCDVGYERFLAPEIYFSPEIFFNDFFPSLPEIIDSSIQACPIDLRKNLYRNVVLSGGSTLFKDFGRRIKKDLKKIVDNRFSGSHGSSKNAIEINVLSHPMQKFAVWFGASIVASNPDFHSACHTKLDYDEHGASICRQNPIFTGS